MSIETRLAELGVTLPDSPAPLANYVPFVQSGSQLFVSGQVSSDENGLIVLWATKGAMPAARYLRRPYHLVSLWKSKPFSKSHPHEPAPQFS